ncbi:hypothetical protein FSP39_014179 [Pinctada imbricata]|uniref:Mab-21-like HhH/H2TH-like domain-containing protein n=1 Tax=Pinctada imbricata TaxID=66713 RepID=A0AA88XVP5_PINIB|nr:hypothetical protein FSP39_014179 [Pinctada imbricata]
MESRTGDDASEYTTSTSNGKTCTEDDVRQIALDGRPEWPYEPWKYENYDENSIPEETTQSLTGNTEYSDGEKQSSDHSSKVQDCSGQDTVIYEPDHWDDTLSEKLDESVPITRLIQFLAPTMDISEDLFQNIKETILSMMNQTADEVDSRYSVFERCYVLPVGSAEEGTKVESPDEFDFAVILPYFDTFEKLLMVIYERNEETTYSDPEFSAIVKEMSLDGHENTIKANFQGALKFIWTEHMENHIPEGWTLLERRCYTKDESIAGTFHFLRTEDNFIVDVDICFWTLLSKNNLEKPSRVLHQRKYIMKHYLGDEQKIYAVLPTDHRIEYELNVVRFAMSNHERNELNKYGPNNGRIKSYKLAKCISKLFLPRITKHKDCDRCFDSMVSSFCLKNIVFFMAKHHTDDTLWTDDQLGNRLLEIFVILNFCMKVNQSNVSTFFVPYSIQLDISNKFNPTDGTMSSIENLVYVIDEHDESGADSSADDESDADDNSAGTVVHLPDSNSKKQGKWYEDDPLSKKLLANYFDFMTKEGWSLAQLIDRLNELLTGLRERDESERKEIADNPGCLCFDV